MYNTYNHQQLIYDLRQIVRFFGKREQHGFFTVGRYQKNEGLEIIDPYVNDPILYFNGVDVGLCEVQVDSDIGEEILRLSLKVEEECFQRDISYEAYYV